MLPILAAITFAAQLAATPPPTVPELRGEALMRALQSGGYTILVRHARTDRSAQNKETPGSTPPLRADQRNLSPDGELDVRRMHDVVEKYHLPISEVLSSPVYRARETADAFGTPAVTMTLRTFPTTAETQALVAAAPKPGTNRVLVTHHFVIENHVPGITPGMIGESEAAVVRPTGDGKVTLAGRIALADWEALAGSAVSTAAPQQHDHSGSAVRVEIPPTVPGKLAVRYLEAFNSGSAETMRSFIEASMVPSAERPTETRLKTYATLFDDYGVLVVTGIHSTTDEAITLVTKSKKGDLIVTVTPSPEQPDHIKSLTFGMMVGGAGHS